MTELRRRVWFAVLCSALACAGVRSPGRSRGAEHVGEPFALTAPDLEGREVDVAAARGKVRVVEFWATWCEPCKDAMPALDQMARELGPRGLEVYGVSVDEDRTKVLDYLRARPVGFRILWDKGAVRLTRLGVTLMPVTFLVDRSGVVRHVYQGWDATRARRERKEIEDLLGQP